MVFYTWDYLFTGLWREKKRAMLAELGVAVAAECNFSTYEGQPLALSLYETFRKRTLSALWGERGVKLLVDLNCGDTLVHRAINLMGVPRGWRAYAMRPHRETGLPALIEDYATACQHAGTSDLTLLVYGGSRRMREWALSIGAKWVPEHNDRVRGRLEGREVRRGQTRRGGQTRSGAGGGCLHPHATEE